jgi:hypothetical protein
MMEITHRIADITFCTESDVLIPHLLEQPFKWFQTDDAEPVDVHCRISQLDPSDQPLPPLEDQERQRIVRSVSFVLGLLERPILRSPKVRAVLQHCLDQPELVHLALRWNRAIIHDFAHNKLDYFYPPEIREDFANPVALARYRNLFAPFLPGFSAVMVHSAGVVCNGLAALFVAPDEGGKTSVVAHAAKVSILNDDHHILRQTGNIIMAHSTPFGTVTSGPQQAKLGGLFLLEKAPRFDLIPLSTQDALQFLWDEHSHVWRFLPKGLRVRAFEVLYTACRQAAIYRMRFPKDYVDWDAIGAAMVR